MFVETKTKKCNREGELWAFDGIQFILFYFILFLFFANKVMGPNFNSLLAIPSLPLIPARAIGGAPWMGIGRGRQLHRDRGAVIDWLTMPFERGRLWGVGGKRIERACPISGHSVVG